MNKTMKFLVQKTESQERLDLYLSKKIKDTTRSYLKKLIEEKKVRINNNLITTPATKIKINDEVSVKFVFKSENSLIPKNIKLNIIYEDNDILIIDKPKGMVVHPGAGNTKDTLANALAYKYKNRLSDVNGKLRPGIVHRIDKETSGLLIIAKNNLAHAKLSKQFSSHSINRKYQCLAWGVIRPMTGQIETLIARDKKNRQIMTVSDFRGKKAITNYKTLKVFNIKDIPKISLIECELKTGRTHQIRVHLKYKGSSILGDNQYGKKNLKFKKINQKFLEILKEFNGQALHAQTIGFIHPTKNKQMDFKSNFPLDFKKMLNFLNNLNN